MRKGFYGSALVFVGVLGLNGCGDVEPSKVAAGGEKVASVNDSPDAAVERASGPESTQSPAWEYVVNNAIRTADNYAAEKGSRASFINKPSVELIKMMGGDLEGSYVIQLVNKNGADVSYSQLKPLFDMHANIEDLDDEGVLWEVVLVKFNGVEIK